MNTQNTKTIDDYLINVTQLYSCNKPATQVVVSEFSEEIGHFSWSNAKTYMIYGVHLSQKKAILKRLNLIN